MRQLDEVFLGMPCDPKYRRQMTDRGDDPEKLAEVYGELINTAIAEIPAGMTVNTLHMRRFSLERASRGDAEWLKDMLERESLLDHGIDLADDDSLTLRVATRG